MPRTAVLELPEPVRQVPIVPMEFPVGLSFTLPFWDKRPEAFFRREYAKGKWGFDRGYRQRAPRDEDRKFGDLTGMLKFGVRVADLLSDVTCLRFGGYDPAGTKRIGNAMVTAAIVPGTNLRVIVECDLWRGSFKEDAARVTTSYLKHKHSLINVENNATQESVLDLIATKCSDIPLAGFTTGMNKAHLEFGVTGLDAEIRAGVWALCMDDPYDTGSPLIQHDATCECAYHTLLTDLDNYDSPGRTYDMLMAWWFCREAIRGVNSIDLHNETPPSDDVGSIPADEMAGSFLT